MTGFTSEIRAALRAGAEASAAVLAPLLIAELTDTAGTMIDVGCGEGWFAREFVLQGWEVLGVDHPRTNPIALASHRFQAVDLGQPIRTSAMPRFDLALSLEVAEHLPPERAPSFIADLCALAPMVVFSAAIPGQGGVGHMNERWPGYWADLFAEQGYDCSGFLRRSVWDDERVEPWYRQNLLVAWSVNRRLRVPEHAYDDCPPIALVHPAIWEAYRGTVSS